MTGRVVPVRVGDVDLLVTTVPVAGTEPTSGRAEDVSRRVTEAFDAVQGAVVEIAGRVAGSVQELAARGRCPETVSVEFGLSFSASGQLVVASSGVEASLRVTVSYGGTSDRAAATGPCGAAAPGLDGPEA